MYATVKKEIPKDDYYLLKSCQAGSWYPSIETSLRYVLTPMGTNFLDDPRQSSCVGCANHIGVIPFLPIVALNARNCPWHRILAKGTSCATAPPAIPT